MQTFRNLRLAVRLGVAFGALAAGLLIVAAVAFVSAGQNQSALESLSHEDVTALELVADLGERSESIAHKTAQHLYVVDGDLEAEDVLQDEIEALRAQNSKARHPACASWLTPTGGAVPVSISTSRLFCFRR